VIVTELVTDASQRAALPNFCSNNSKKLIARGFIEMSLASVSFAARHSALA
jgi:hypothetical protein